MSEATNTFLAAIKTQNTVAARPIKKRKNRVPMSDEERENIRADATSGEMSRKEVCEKYDRAAGVVSRICSGKFNSKNKPCSREKIEIIQDDWRMGKSATWIAKTRHCSTGTAYKFKPENLVWNHTKDQA